MSTKIMSLCWDIVDISAAQKSVLISLADQANDDGVCWPSVGTISKRCCLSDRAVQKAINVLIERGILSRDQRYLKSSVFTIHVGSQATEPYSPPPERGSPPPRTRFTTPPNEVHHPPEPRSPRTVIDPSIDPSLNRKDNTRKKTRAKKSVTMADFDFTEWPEKPSEKIWEAWVLLRKEKRATITQVAIDRLGKQITKAGEQGFSVDDCLGTALERGWTGFNADWMRNANGNNQRPSPGYLNNGKKPNYHEGIDEDGRF